MADPLLPALSIQDVSVQADRQQCKLIPTSEAKKTKKDATPWPVMQNEETALKEAKRRCHRTQPTEVQYLGQLVLIFGHYKWLLENDVGYANLLQTMLHTTQGFLLFMLYVIPRPTRSLFPRPGDVLSATHGLKR
ncbi:uncharacterized protein [Branchiostoma lanceolatum]|uniref:uncharacterized protein isoform X3 n=1 Tax=Branchiostoma lanceolatum TaxID=7740 RepID=UPI003452CC98